MTTNRISMRQVVRVCLCMLVAICTPAMAQTPAQVNSFVAGPPSGLYSFPSTTPRSLPELLKDGGASAPAVNALGHLFLPPGTDKVPAVLLVHGSGGIRRAMVEYWPQRFNGAGYAVMALDLFAPRGVKSTEADQSQVPFAADMADAFAALKLLATHPRIDAGKITIMGFSRGGIAAWRTAVERVITAQRLPGGLRFAAHVQFYSGGCSDLFRLMVKPGVFSKSPMLWVHGDADDYVPMAPCQDYAEHIGKAGTPAEFVVVAGARHVFDSDDFRLVQVPRAQRSVGTCPLEMDIDNFAYYDRTTSQRLQGDALAAAMKACSALGASVEGNSAARDKSAEATLAFFKKVFGR